MGVWEVEEFASYALKHLSKF